MEQTPRVPLELLCSIIDSLATEQPIETASLQAMSLACKSTLPLCRSHLFASIDLRTSKRSSAKRFSNLLAAKPDLACYIQAFAYEMSNSSTVCEVAMLKVLEERSSRLRSLHISSEIGSKDWKTLSESMRSSIVSLIQLSSVTHLRLEYMKNFPAAALAICPNIDYLHVEQLEISTEEVKDVGWRSAITRPLSIYARRRSFRALSTLMRFSCPDTGPIIDFRFIKTASLYLEHQGIDVAVSELLRMTTQLQVLRLMVSSPVTLSGLGSCLTINAYRTLTLADFQVIVDGDHYDPLCGLNEELKMIARNAVLEEIKLFVRVQTDRSCRSNSRDWSDLDTLLAEPENFSLLRRVACSIRWHSFSRSEEKVQEVMDSLTEKDFPRLSENRAIEFVFSVDHEYV